MIKRENITAFVVGVIFSFIAFVCLKCCLGIELNIIIENILFAGLTGCIFALPTFIVCCLKERHTMYEDEISIIKELEVNLNDLYRASEAPNLLLSLEQRRRNLRKLSIALGAIYNSSFSFDDNDVKRILDKLYLLNTCLDDADSVSYLKDNAVNIQETIKQALVSINCIKNKE